MFINTKLLTVVVALGIIGGMLIGWARFNIKKRKDAGEQRKIVMEVRPTIVTPISTATPTMTPTATPTKTPVKQLSFTETNKIYGPCTILPVLMYHHIEEAKDAAEKHQSSLNVTPENLRKDLEYLKTNNYITINLADLTDFFDNGKPMPKKAVALTFDDAYEDNYTKMWPMLKEYGFKATIFTPTGLVQNPEYLSWEQIKEMSSSGLVYFGNHTWSHHSSSGSLEVLEKEISLADTQLNEHGENQQKNFAYPYGKPSNGAETVLKKLGYKLAFTTIHGTMMCKGKRYELPRIRIGDAGLKSYGL